MEAKPLSAEEIAHYAEMAEGEGDQVVLRLVATIKDRDARITELCDGIKEIVAEGRAYDARVRKLFRA